MSNQDGDRRDGVSKGIVGFGHVTIVVNDLAATKRFYGELLGLPEARRPPWTAPGAWYQIGAAHLHIQVKPEFVPHDYPVGPHFAIFTPRETYHDVIRRLEAAGVVFRATAGRRRQPMARLLQGSRPATAST
jgi:catechol 2,3-dioxygenase-like lactoylglutathione lyase family enzyme